MKLKVKYLLLVMFFLTGIIQAQTSFLQNFQNPPKDARPRVWWHWMNGNITKDGIQKDLEWMQSIGIAGFQNFDANLFTPLVVEKKLEFMQLDWKDAFQFTTKLADQMGMEMAIAGSPGWSETGGPWVEPQDGMKKYVWTETQVPGGKTFTGLLPQPPDNAGIFQNAKLTHASILGDFIGTPPHFYQDAIVIAYPLPELEKKLADLNPKVTSSGGNFTLEELTDNNLSKGLFLPPAEVGQDMWIQYAFESPQTFKAFSIAGFTESPLSELRGGPGNRSLKVSDDGVSFRTIARVSGSTVSLNTVSIPATTSRYWRICFETLPPIPNLFAALLGAPVEAPKPAGVDVAEFVLHNTARIDQVEDKAGFSAWKEDTETFIPSDAGGISKDAVVDLTSKMKADGSLEWDVPEGNWVIIRLGYSLTGRQNHPASPEATGLEVDKLDKEAVRKYINTYLDMYKNATGGMIGERGLGYIILDSYEAGHMNWTKNLPEEFKQRCGYDIKPWIPVLTGRIVESAEASEKFLWDFRKTIGEMIAQNHYDVIGEELHKRGMKRYTESHEGGRAYLADGMDVKRNADVPMSAMWTPGSFSEGPDEEERSKADIRESASVANIYGQPFVAAESMTSVQNGFSFHPEKLKRTADMELASGLNRYVIHTSVHQPLDDKMPGFSLGPFGQYFTRQETWAEQAKPWVDYLSRSSYLLQQGRNVADILYYYGENTNITYICQEKLPSVPNGFEFDFVNSTALLEAIEAKNGQLVAKSGNTYRVLMLDDSASRMTVPVLKKIQQLAMAGVKIIGERPEKSPSLADDDAEFQKIASEVWSHSNVTTFEALNLQPDVSIKGAQNEILFRHRQTSDMDIFWLNNRGIKPTNAEVSFRINGKVPELWHPQTGKKEEVSYRIQDGRTIIPLQFESWDAFFIIFKDAATANSYIKPVVTKKPIQTVSGPWKLNFQSDRGAPTSATFEQLISWSAHENPGIRYFSGTATYQNRFKMPKLSKSADYLIDLGKVKNLAEIVVNGKNMGVVWKQPFLLDITNALKKGSNTIEIKVTNVWVNRLIGDAQPNVREKITFTTVPFYNAEDTLLPSGLLGPVIIFEQKK